MTTRQNTQSLESTEAPLTEVPVSDAIPVRRAYVSPVLRHLGSVRDLTLGMSNKIGEGGRMNM